MAKLRKWIGNLKVSAKLQVYRMAVLVMTAFFVLVALVSTLVIRSTIHSITEVWSPSLECLQELQTITAKYRIKQYQHLVDTGQPQIKYISLVEKANRLMLLIL